MAQKIARVNTDLVGGGVIVGPGATSVTVNDKVISVINDTVQTHGDPPHVMPPIITGAPTIFAEDKKINLTSISRASCSHTVDTGSSNTFGL